MKVYLSLVVVCALAMLAPLAASAEKLTLDEAYALARRRSENLELSEESVRTAEAQYRQAIATIYPRLHLVATERVRGQDGLVTGGSGTGTNDPDLPASEGRSFNRSTDKFETSFSVTQPIFSGFREFYLAAAAQDEMAALKHLYNRRLELLYLDVTDLFNQMLLYTAELDVLRKSEGVLNDRIGELRKWLKLGKSRDGEVTAAEADIADLHALRDEARGLLEASREMLAFLTGLPAQAIEPDTSGKSTAAALRPLDEYVAASARRSDVQAADYRVRSQQRQLVAAERAKWPNVSLEGNYFVIEEPQVEEDWDVLVRFDLPLFEGGGLDARIDEQRSLVRTREIERAQLARQLERDVRVAHANLVASQQQSRSLQDLVQAAQRRYESQRKDYELGVVTNLDVLQAIRQLHDARRRLLRAESDVRINTARLRVQAGDVLPELEGASQKIEAETAGTIR